MDTVLFILSLCLKIFTIYFAAVAVFALKNRFFRGEELELLQPGREPHVFRAENAVNEEGEALALFNVPQMKVQFAFPFPVSEYAILRKKKERPN